MCVYNLSFLFKYKSKLYGVCVCVGEKENNSWMFNDADDKLVQ